MGASHLELDVHLTRDDYLVIIHDDTVDRTTNGAGPVASQTLAALSRHLTPVPGLEKPSWGPHPYACRGVDALSRTSASPYRTQRAYSAPAPADGRPGARPWHGATRHLHLVPACASADDAGLCSRVSHGLAGGEISDAVIAQAHALGCAQLCPRASLVTPGLVQRLHAEGFECVPGAWRMKH